MAKENLEILLESVEKINNSECLTDQLPDFLDLALDLTVTDLMRFCRVLVKNDVKRGDVRRFRADLKAYRKEKEELAQKQRRGNQVIKGRVVKQGYAIMEALFELGYDFKFNKLDNCIEVNGEPLTDGMMAVIEVGMSDMGFEREKKIRRAYTAYAFQNSYSPPTRRK